MKIKELKIYTITVTVLLIMSIICLATIISVNQCQDTYTVGGYITDRINDEYFVTFDSGHIFSFYSDEEIQMAEYVYVTIKSNNTETVKDDEIIEVRVDKTFSIKDE